MRLTSFTDYSLRVLIYLAIHGEGRVTIAEVSNAFGVSEHHLVKVVHFLGKAGFLATVRGRGGGLRLARPPGAINIGAVVRETEPRPRPVECFQRETNACPIARLCRLSGMLAEAVRTFHEALDQYTLEDVASNRRALAKILLPPRRQSDPAPALHR